MLKVANIVEEIINGSEIAHSALSAGLLNLSAYAKTIRSEVERKTRKEVRHGTIVVALSRLSKTLSKRAALLPKVRVENLSVKTGLVEIAFDRNKANRNLLRSLYQNEQFMEADFFTVTHGVTELSIIVPENFTKTVLKVFSRQKPKLLIDKLASLTVRYKEDCLFTPNVNYAVMRPLALKRINIVEIVSTYTELTFIVGEQDLQEAFLILSKLFHPAK